MPVQPCCFGRAAPGAGASGDREQKYREEHEALDKQERQDREERVKLEIIEKAERLRLERLQREVASHPWVSVTDRQTSLGLDDRSTVFSQI